jgi:predicted ribosomally synthesized peptide with SipW-like signal peptide
MNLKRLVLSVGMLAFAGAVVVGGTGAFFSDTESSTGNVFAAGDVTLTLSGLTHTYLAAEPSSNLPNNYFKVNQNGKSFTFGDLKPLDWGEIEGDLVNEGNPAFICARVVAPNTAGVSPFKDLLKFRVNGGNGLTFNQTLGVTGLNQWFSLNPAAPALALGTGATTSAPVQYCFGDFISSNGGCVLNPAVNYNAAQGQTLTLDLEFYAVQQRNNAGFTCSSLNQVRPEPAV